VLLSPILGRDGNYGLETNGMEERLVISVVWSGSFFEGLLRRRIDFGCHVFKVRDETD